MKALASFFLLVFTYLIGLPMGISQNQPGNQDASRRSQALPHVFMLGEYDKQYEAIIPGYISLLDACDSDMKVAYEKLMSMMREMEAYSVLEKYDLKGVNAWMHIFWKEDGGIEHIGFYLKPNSRNVDTEKLRAFLNDFAAWYKIPVRSNKKFSHYSSFSFPVAFQNPTSSEGEKSTVKKGDSSNY